jgi:hypothetical protein
MGEQRLIRNFFPGRLREQLETGDMFRFCTMQGAIKKGGHFGDFGLPQQPNHAVQCVAGHNFQFFFERRFSGKPSIDGFLQVIENQLISQSKIHKNTAIITIFSFTNPLKAGCWQWLVPIPSSM